MEKDTLVMDIENQFSGSCTKCGQSFDTLYVYEVENSGLCTHCFKIKLKENCETCLKLIK